MNSIKKSISDGNITLGERIPSINEVSERFDLSRDTVEKAYRNLKKQNIIESVRGKGYYIANTDLKVRSKILFLINKLSTYKMRIFNSFVDGLGNNAQVDLDIYHCEPSVFCDVLEKKSGLYDYLVLMPHFKNSKLEHIGCTEAVLDTIQNIPAEKLILLDRDLKSLYKNIGRVYQNFTEDIFDALSSYNEKIKHYKKIILVYPEKTLYPYPKGIKIGFKKFCNRYNHDFEVLPEIYESMELQTGDLYVVIEENDLVNLVKQSRDRHYKLGEEIGIISYNETPLKDLLDISVITTDFCQMGITAAEMILKNDRNSMRNNFMLIDRNSV